jgi:serine/threonine protein kinase/tetratricopeptide (TPR) repeat protein
MGDSRDGPTLTAAKLAEENPTARRQRLTIAQKELQKAVGQLYRLEKEVGRGGFGLVLQARDLRRDETVCIKVVRPDMAHGFTLVRFKREFRTARRLHHPRCVQVFDLEHANGLWFFSMEQVTGASLLQRRALHGDARTVAAIGVQILAALDELHGRSIVHRDVKPHNILVAASDDGRVPVAKLTDFGIAKVGDLDDDETVRSLRGSPPYLAPEVVTDGIADARADLYALGVTLYEALTGRHPLGEARTTVEWLARIRRAELVPLTQVAPDIPGPVATVVMRLCAKDPAARYRSAAAAYDELVSWLAKQGSAAVPELPPLSRAPYLAAPRLVGRRDEQARIESFLAANLDVSPGSRRGPPLLLLSGPAGVGKSRLLSWLLRAAEGYAPRVLVGQGRSEIGAPFEAVASILRGLRGAGRRLSAEEGGESQEVTATALGQDVLARSPAALNETGATGANAGSQSIGTVPDGQGLRQLLQQYSDQLLRAGAERPTLVVVEDLQWSDAETLELIKVWTRAVAAARDDGCAGPIALVATHRPVADHAALATWTSELQTDGCALAVPVQAPSRAATVELAAELLMCPIDDALTSACARLFGDRPVTPLYVGQVLRLLVSRGVLAREHGGGGRWNLAEVSDEVRRLIPATVEQAIGERAARLSVDSKALLSAAAVLGRRFALAPASRVAGVDPSLAQDCIEEAERAGFVAEPAEPAEPGSLGGEASFVFVHDRLREALYEALSAEQRRHLHGAAASALIAGSHRKGRDIASDLAHHYHLAGDHEGAYRFSALAGQRALRGQQFSRASDLLAQAVEHADALGKPVLYALLCRLGDAAALALHIERAEAAYQRALAASRSRDRRLHVLTRVAELYDRAHKAEAALDWYSQAMAQGLPWYLRGPVLPWLLLGLVSVLVVVLPPAAVVWFCRQLWRQTPSARREALVRCARLASRRAFTHSRVKPALRFGIFVLVGGLGGRAGDASFALGTAAVKMLFANLGLARRSLRWRELDTASSDSWRDDDRIFYYLTRGGAELFSAQEEGATRDLGEVFALAMERKDPLEIEASAVALTGAFVVFARPVECFDVINAVRRFARDQDQRFLAPTLWFFDLQTNCSRLAFDRARRVAIQPVAQGTSIDPLDYQLPYLARFYALLSEARLARPSVDLGYRVVALLAEVERLPISMPIYSRSAWVFALAVEVWAPLARERPVPVDVARQLARARRRWRPIDGRGPWRKPYWLVCYALYDAMQGQIGRARRELARGLDLLARDGADAYRAWLCGAGLRVFAPGTDLARRCDDDLQQIAVRRPGLRAAIEQERLGA